MAAKRTWIKLSFSMSTIAWNSFRALTDNGGSRWVVSNFTYKCERFGSSFQRKADFNCRP
jgi:hypothetical protein